MTTYIVFTKDLSIDQNELDLYQSKVRETFEGHSVKILAAYGTQQALEGSAPEGVVIMEFPTTTAARDWYYSDAYQAAARHRFKGANYRAVLVEGIQE
ncbi:DUF1330 domain-containing protein [Paraburkholderia sp. BCC1885]|uniref:DUF1330 domain-containing protein n=1 Tax=Paraburkholderia sp. BCC1885 TaxID=2562669 RepID=UPI001182D0BC|nr:DUF1330 domain-containing protein [Paraburkholderia sp. BCC1885]